MQESTAPVDRLRLRIASVLAVRAGPAIVIALLALSCGSPATSQTAARCADPSCLPSRPPPSLVVAPASSATTSPVASASAAPPRPPEPAPRIGRGAAREAAEAAFRRLQPALGGPVQLEASDGVLACAPGSCVWQWRLGYDAELGSGTIEVDGETGAVVYAPNDGRADRLAIDAFLARTTQRNKAIAAVAALPVVKAYCKRVAAQKLGCLVHYEEDPSGEGCGPNPALESSCWMTVYVGEAHATHASRFATFLVAPGTFRVAGASGFCGPAPIASFSKSPNGNCPE